MTMQRVTLACLIQLGLVSSVWAQDQGSKPLVAAQFVDIVGGLSLDDAIRHALEHEPSVRAMRSDVDAARGRQLQAGLAPNPTVAVDHREAGTDNQTMVQMQLPLELFRRAPRVDMAAHQVEVSERAAAERARVVGADVRSRYGTAAGAIRDLALADQAVDLVSRQFELVRQRAAEGAVPPLERDQLQVELYRYEADQMRAGGRVEEALIELKRAMGLNPAANLRLRDTLDVLATPALGSSAGVPEASPVEAARRRPDVMRAGAEVRLAESRIGRAAAEGRIDVSLFGGYMRMNFGFVQRGLTDSGRFEPVRSVFHYATAGAMVTVPFLNRNQGEVKAARAEQGSATLRFEEAQLTALAQIAAAEVRDVAARRALAMTASTVELAGRNLDVVRQAYELGRTSMSDVLREQRQYLEVERERTDAMKMAFEAQAALHLARGER